MPWAPLARDASAGFYDTARIEYRLDAGKLGQPLDVIRIDGRRVAYEQVASSPLADQSIGTLVIQYPHPGGLPDMARVTFSLDSGRVDPAEAAGWNPLKTGQPAIKVGHEEIHEVWAMNIPRAESDQYFRLLSTQNFYHAESIESGAAELAVTINGRDLRKNWEQVPELNQLVQRVRRDGQLVGYLRPAALAGTGNSAIASTHAYRELLAEAGGAMGGTPGRPQNDVLPQSPGAAGPRTAARMPYAAR
ncbi:MAG: hypothetical protein WD063_04505 [Pirellulales bacterium]